MTMTTNCFYCGEPATYGIRNDARQVIVYLCTLHGERKSNAEVL